MKQLYLVLKRGWNGKSETPLPASFYSLSSPISVFLIKWWYWWMKDENLKQILAWDSSLWFLLFFLLPLFHSFNNICTRHHSPLSTAQYSLTFRLPPSPAPCFSSSRPPPSPNALLSQDFYCTVPIEPKLWLISNSKVIWEHCFHIQNLPVQT